jgi:hypothetical protein
MTSLLVVLAVGFALGYAAREGISRRCREAERRRYLMDHAY